MQQLVINHKAIKRRSRSACQNDLIKEQCSLFYYCRFNIPPFRYDNTPTCLSAPARTSGYNETHGGQQTHVHLCLPVDATEADRRVANGEKRAICSSRPGCWISPTICADRRTTQTQAVCLRVHMKR